MDDPDFWSNKHVVVTGGAGFLGTSIVRALHNRKAGSVTARGANSAIYCATITSRIYSTRCCEQSTPLEVIVIHAAARVGGIGANAHQP